MNQKVSNIHAYAEKVYYYITNEYSETLNIFNKNGSIDNKHTFFFGHKTIFIPWGVQRPMYKEHVMNITVKINECYRNNENINNAAGLVVDYIKGTL